MDQVKPNPTHKLVLPSPTMWISLQNACADSKYISRQRSCIISVAFRILEGFKMLSPLIKILQINRENCIRCWISCYIQKIYIGSNVHASIGLSMVKETLDSITFTSWTGKRKMLLYGLSLWMVPLPKILWKLQTVSSLSSLISFPVQIPHLSTTC